MNPPFFLVDPATGTRHPLKTETTIGRTTGDILMPDDRRVSSKHCKIAFTQAGITIEDLKSSNGTMVNGVKLTPGLPMLLEPGAQIACGGTVFELVYEPPQPAPSATPAATAPPPMEPAKPLPILGEPKEKSSALTNILGFVLILVAGGMLFVAWKQQKGGKKKAPATVAEAATQPTTIDLYMETSSEEFDRLTASYARLIDSVNIDNIDRKAAVIEIKTGLEPLCRRLLEETRKIKPTTESDRIYINLHQKVLFSMHQHMATMTSFWENGDPALEKEAEKNLADYLEASRQIRIYLDNR